MINRNEKWLEKGENVGRGPEKFPHPSDLNGITIISPIIVLHFSVSLAQIVVLSRVYGCPAAVNSSFLRMYQKPV